MNQRDQEQVAGVIVAAVARRKRIMASGLCELPKPPKRRNHPKRHSENRERSHFERQKQRRVDSALDAKARLHKKHKKAMRLYWSGAAADLSSAMQAAGLLRADV